MIRFELACDVCGEAFIKGERPRDLRYWSRFCGWERTRRGGDGLKDYCDKCAAQFPVVARKPQRSHRDLPGQVIMDFDHLEPSGLDKPAEMC